MTRPGTSPAGKAGTEHRSAALSLALSLSLSGSVPEIHLACCKEWGWGEGRRGRCKQPRLKQTLKVLALLPLVMITSFTFNKITSLLFFFLAFAGYTIRDAREIYKVHFFGSFLQP